MSCYVVLLFHRFRVVAASNLITAPTSSSVTDLGAPSFSSAIFGVDFSCSIGWVELFRVNDVEVRIDQGAITGD